MLKEISEFLKNNKKFIIVSYKGKRLSAASDWRLLRNPIKVAINGIFTDFLFIKLPPCKLKNFLYSLLGMKIGKDVVISPDVFIDPFFPEFIELEDGVILGWGSKILTHEITQKHFRIGRVKIKKKALIGAFSLIRCGIEIGNNSIISAMTFVKKDVPANKLLK